jgi:drug/metabolite transporter (DMT)-like permease
MVAFGALAGLGASFFWALGSLLAHAPARLLGPFEFTRTQLISASLVLAILVAFAGGWATVSWTHAIGFAVSSAVGVVLGNLAMVSCLARGGPQRTQLLMMMNAPIAATLGYVMLDETVSAQQLLGALLVLFGVVLAILHRPGKQHTDAKTDIVHGPFAVMMAFGILAAACNAVSLIALKPALIAGTDPLAATALRTGGGAAIMVVIALWPAKVFEPASPRTGRLVCLSILPGILGYVIAVSLQLIALRVFGTGIAAVLSSAAPVMILPMIWIAKRERPRTPAWIGACLALVGAGLIAQTHCPQAGEWFAGCGLVR